MKITNWKRIVSFFLCLVLLLSVNGMEPVKAEIVENDKEIMTVTVTYGQEGGRLIGKYVNYLRTGVLYDEVQENLPELEYDYELEEVAMQRAAEIAFSYSHTRPNGENWDTAYPAGVYSMKAENILGGDSRAENDANAFNLLEAGMGYDGQESMQNMLSRDFNRIGVGHVFFNNTHYWVLEFGTATRPTVETPENNSETTREVEVLQDNIKRIRDIKITPESIIVDEGKEVDLPVVTAGITLKDTKTWYQDPKVAVKTNGSYMLETTSCAELKDGKLVGKKAGTTILTINTLELNLSVPVTVNEVICDHVWGDFKEIIASTCENKGRKQRICTLCQKVEEEEIPAKGHSYDMQPVWEWSEGNSTAFAIFICTNDSDHIQRIEAELTVEGQAACTQAGERVTTASVTFGEETYKDVKREWIAALGHTETKTVTDPTCTTTGYTAYICSRCGNKRIEDEKMPLGHNYREKVVVPTCTEGGYTIHICSRCSNSYRSNETDALGHDLTHYDAKAATCTEKGWKAYDMCSRCDYTTYQEIAASGHETKIIDTKRPTCTETGLTGSEVCTVCGEMVKKNTVIPATGHNYIYGKCTDCGNIDETYGAFPFVEGKKKAQGWNAIMDRIQTVPRGQDIIINMNGHSIVPGAVIEFMKGKDVGMVIKQANDICWTIRGNGVTGNRIADFNILVEQKTDQIPNRVLTAAIGNQYCKQFHLDHKGDLGFEAILTIPMGVDYRDRQVQLYYYNEKNRKLEFQSASIVDKNGNVQFTLTHASDYAVVVKDEMPGSPQTGDGDMGTMVLAVLMLAGAAAVFWRKSLFMK